MTTPTNPIERLAVPLAEVEAQLLRPHEAKVARKQGRAANTDDSSAVGQAAQEPEPFGADRMVTAAEPGARYGYGCTATGQRWKVAGLPKTGKAYSSAASARAVALDLNRSKWVAECDRHGPVPMALNKFGAAVADVSAAYVYSNEQAAADAVRLHLDAHARKDADVMTPEDIEAAQGLNFSRDQWRTLGWIREGKVGETADGFTAYDISPDRADVAKRIRKNLVPCLWAAGFVKALAVAPGAREFRLTDEGADALRMWSNAMRIRAVTEPEKDTRHPVVKDAPYPLLSAGKTWPGEQQKAQAAAEAEQAARERAACSASAEEKAAADRAASPTADELAVGEALNTDDLDADVAAVLSAAYIGHVVTRHRPGATSVRLDENAGQDGRRVTRTSNINGVEKPITPEAAAALSTVPANLTDATAETWHALCTSVDEWYGVYRLDLTAAIDADTTMFALLDQAAPPTGPSEEDIDGPGSSWCSQGATGCGRAARAAGLPVLGGTIDLVSRSRDGGTS